jgi:hypothetical protein
LLAGLLAIRLKTLAIGPAYGIWACRLFRRPVFSYGTLHSQQDLAADCHGLHMIPFKNNSCHRGKQV